MPDFYLATNFGASPGTGIASHQDSAEGSSDRLHLVTLKCELAKLWTSATPTQEANGLGE